MKKAITVLLTLCLLLTALTPAFARSAAGLRVAVASDIHYNLPEETFDADIDDPIFYYANRRAAMENESGAILDAFLRQCADDAVDYVLIPGDMADNGRSTPAEHEAVRDKLLAFERETGIEVFVIDGNHDLGEKGEYCAFGMEEFKANYALLGYDHALETVSDDCSYTADLGEKYRLIALDSCDYSKSTEDGMTLKKVNWVVRQAKQAYADGRYPILMMHHNLLDHLPMQRIISRNFIIRNHLATANRFADAGIRLALTGHEHCSDAAEHISPAGSRICDLTTTSLTMYPLAYRVIDFTDDAIAYASRKLEKLDTAALKAEVPAFTDAQLAAMDADLDAYARQFAVKGITYRLQLQLTMEKIGIAPGEPFYDLVNAATRSLDELLRLPLYGEGSVSEIAARYHIEIPQTDYETGWDLAASLVTEHYAGGEAYEVDDPRVTALLRTASLILKFVPDQTADALLSDAGKAVADALTGQDVKALCRRLFGGVTPGEYLIAAILSPIIYGFVMDDDAPDNDGTLHGYGADDRRANLLEKFRAFFANLNKMFENIFRILHI